MRSHFLQICQMYACKVLHECPNEKWVPVLLSVAISTARAQVACVSIMRTVICTLNF